MKVADLAWVALAQLHRANPQISSFRSGTILRQASLLSTEPLKPGVQAHISSHNIANIKPQPVQNRMFLRLQSGELRLFRAGDAAHPDRHGKVKPSRADLPAEFYPLLDWYDNEYCAQSVSLEDDPVLAMIGIGKELWADENGDAFIRRLRDETTWNDGTPGASPTDRLWSRVVNNQTLVFRTSTGLPFTFRIEGNGIWFYREGRRINQFLSRSDFDKAAARLPLKTTTEIKDCRNYTYLFGLLTDSRIVDPSSIAA